jgi:DUF2946 family protein
VSPFCYTAIESGGLSDAGPFAAPDRVVVRAGEVCSVLQLAKTRRWMRPWIAMVAAYALALQLLLTGVAAAQAMAADDTSSGELFAICHSAGDGIAGDHGGTGKSQQPQAPCALCTLSSTGVAVLPTAHVLSTVDAKSLSDVVPWNDVEILAYDSPTGQYSRGPPASVRSSG